MSETLAGYTGLPTAGSALRRKGSVTGCALSADSLVRGKNHVDGVKAGGYIVQDEIGYLNGYDAGEFADRFHLLPATFIDSVVSQPTGQVGAAYSELVLSFDNSPATVTAASLTFGAVATGLALSFTVPTAITLIGTPGVGTSGPYYFEITTTWSDGTSAVQRYAMVVLAAA